MSRAREQGFGFRPKLIAVSVAVCFALNAPQVLANPTGATVASGSAGFATAGNTLTVTNSANAIINWQGFSIGINEITRFLQPSAASAVLNRVVGSGGVIPQSVIDGVLSSNGRVFLLNPMGVVIGANARIDVAGLVASSLNLSDQDFLNGTLRFTEVPGAGAVVNHGVIETATGGRVYLVAPQVENSGIIRAPQGEIVLAAGKSADLISESSPYVTVRVVADAEQALNVGSLISDSGRIGMYGALLRHSGVAEANGATLGPGGQIRFVAAKDLTVDAGSRISANGTSGGQVVLQAEGGTNLIAGTVEATGNAGKGGTVQALGVRVGVIGNGVIDASGETGGGTVLVGGDYQGKNAAVQNAERTYIGRDGVIRADARTTGDGGRVIVWADGDTRFYGSISARGGSQAGDGGFVETSGKHNLDFRGVVDTRAPKGRAGTLLLDPDTVTITHGTSDSNIMCNDSTDCYGAAPPFTDMAGDFAPGTLSDGTINTQLNTGNVVVQTSTGDILIDGTGVAIAPTGGLNAQTLTLNAYGSIGWSGDWSYTNNGVLTLLANNGTIFNNAGKLTAGSVILSAFNGIGCGQCPGSQFLQTQVTNLQATNTNRGIEINNTGNLTLMSLGAGYAVQNTNGAVRIDSTGSITVSNSVTAGNIVALRADGDLRINADITSRPGGESNPPAELIADRDGNGTGSITQNATSVITTNNNDLDIGIVCAPGDGCGDDSGGGGGGGGNTQNIMLGRVNTGTGGVYIRTEGGGVQDANGAGLNITASDLVIRSTRGVNLDTAVSRLTVRNGPGTGDVAIRNAYGGALRLESFFFESSGAVKNAGGAITVTNTGSIALFDDVDSGTARTTLSAGDEIFQNGGTITAGELVLSAVNGIESGSEGGGLRTQVGSLQATNSGPFENGIVIRNTGNLTLADLGAGYAVRNVGGGLNIRATGDINVNSAVMAGRRISLRADGNLALNANITAGPNRSGESAVLIADADENGTGSVTSSPGFGNISTNGGSLVVYGGSVTVGGINTTRSSGDLLYGGGAVNLVARSGSIVVNGIIDTQGADGAYGSHGGDVELRATNSILVGPPATPGVNRVVINTSGGDSSASGAYGGTAGDVFIDPNSITINGIIQATGGAGGPGGPGGDAGSLALLTPNKAGTITFINGGYDLIGGAGSPAGRDAIPYTPDATPPTLRIEGTLIFVTLLNEVLSDPVIAQAVGAAIKETLNDPLSNPVVAQAVGASIKETLDAVDTEKSEEQQEDESANRRKKGFSSCKPA